MVPQWLELVLKYYSLWSFHFVPSVKLGGIVISCLILLCHIVLCSWFSFITLRTFVEMRAQMEFLDSLNFFLYFIAYSASYWLIISDSYINQRYQNNFWNIYSKINNEFSSQIEFEKWNYLGPFIFLIIGISSNFTFVLFRERNTKLATIMMHIALLFIHDHRVFFYLLHLKTIAYQLWKIEKKLKNMGKSNALVIQDSQFHVENQFKWVLSYYELVHKMSENLNRIFGWSQLISVLLTFYSSVTFLSFIYRQIDKKFAKIDSGMLFFLLQIIVVWFKMLTVKIISSAVVNMTSSICMLSRIAFQVFYSNKYTYKCYDAVS